MSRVLEGLHVLQTRAVVRTGLVCALGGTVVGLCAAAVAIPNGQVTVGVVLRSVLVVVLLTGVVGYLLDPLSWVGRGFVTQLFLEPGAVTVLADLALWLVLAWGACTLRVRDGQRRSAIRDSGYLPG